MRASPLGEHHLQLVEAYGDGRFRIGGEVHEGSVLVFPHRTLAWPVRDLAALTGPELAAALGPVAEAPPAATGVDEAEPPRPEILLLGCGARMAPVPPEAREALRAAGVVIEPMDTGAACRTFNVLVAEARRVAAALVAV